MAATGRAGRAMDRQAATAVRAASCDHVVNIEVTDVRRLALLLSTLSLVLVGASLPARADDAVTRCVAIDEDEARLACFDAATGRHDRDTKDSPATVAPSAPAPVVVAPAASAAPSASDTASDNFGLPAQQRTDAPSRIVARVSAVAPHSHIGRWVVTLDNGQIWEQRETTAATKRPRPGDEVTIEEASLNSYLMVAAGRWSSRVKRVR